MIDTNEIGGFILACRQTEYLQQLKSIIEQRLADLESPSTVCQTCSGRKVIMRGYGAKMEQIACPVCQPKAVEDPKVVQGLTDQINGLQEVILKQNARIEELEKSLSNVQSIEGGLADEVASTEGAIATVP